MQMPEAATGVFFKILQNSQENTRPQACNFIKKETLAQVFSCEFCKIFKNTFFTEQLWTTDSAMRTLQKQSKRNRLSLLLRGGWNAYYFG